ncbi:MAG: long-chain fatty acid--CoA ligase [Myxococcaceae bacterium]|nr:long-chain fatty acid--CoA ligase [Myxococcaceae bacterium]
MTADHAYSVPALLLWRVNATPDAPAYRVPLNPGWKTVTYRELLERVRAISAGLRALGLRNEQRCAILSSTRFDWILADYGTLCAGGATTTIYPSSTADECAYILKDSATAFVFAEDDTQVAKLVERRSELKGVKAVITFDGKAGAGGWVMTLAELEAKGRAHLQAHAGELEAVIQSVRKDSLATLIYTSGTTGRPKGVELTQDNWLCVGEGIEALGVLGVGDVQYLWLPLAHSFGKVLQLAQLRIGFVTAVDGRQDKLVEHLGQVQPTFVAAVPRIFEKVYNRVVASAKEGGALKHRLFSWALGVGREVSALRLRGKSVSGPLAVKHAVADALVFSKLRARFGGRIRYFVSGSAPLSPWLAEFFHAAGITILEGYGLTESSAANFVNRPDKLRFGTVGPPLTGIEVKVSPVDGEVLLRGRAVMRGYHNLPDVTAEALDAEGWLHTGDIGSYEDGFLKITDRKKDLIKTSGGKYVAPQSFEGRLKVSCPYVSQALVHGNSRNFCTALVALDEESIRKWAKENGLDGMTYAQLAAHERVNTLIQSYVDELNASLANFEQVKKFALLPQDLTLEAGDLTPSLKLKRKAVETKYRHVLDSFYAGTLEAR